MLPQIPRGINLEEAILSQLIEVGLEVRPLYGQRLPLMSRQDVRFEDGVQSWLRAEATGQRKAAGT
eukprot:7073262-Prymnesium_polylepis.1